MRKLTASVALGLALCVSQAATAKPGDPGRDKVVAAIKADHDSSIERLRDWIKLPTIANMNLNHKEGAEYMRQLALDAGFQQAKVVATDGVPGVFATLDAGAKDTLAIYFMYDVKHYEPAEWSSPPLEGRIVDRAGEGKALIGRGAVNQKGPETAFLTALRAFKTAGVKLPVNLVFVAEGEEEIGSTHFSQIVTQPEVRAALEKAVGIIIPSASQSVDGAVTLSLGAKGVVELQLISSGEKWGRGPNKDVHSSLKASVDSPVWHLVKALNTLVSEDGQTPAIDGWYENVKPLTARQKEIIAADVAAGSEADDMKVLGIKHWYKDEDYLTSQYRLAEQPTVNIQGLVSGYTGPGGKTVLPGRAEAKLDLRLVPDMTKDEAVSKIKAHLAKRGFGDIEVNVSGGYSPTQTDENSRLIKVEQATLAAAGIPMTMSARSAGSWPGVVFTGEPLKLAAGQFGGGRGGGAHAPNEWLLIDSSNPKVLGFDGQAILYADFLYEVARSTGRK
ncbi:M20/M25/M40 family metallo-hydrolase [Sphingomonas sp. RB56-2]|uniref:M20/M25/M40 family metallo-hydrolase n=1 Tax=Sphingomonas brevis TaxID=2908206 RepID=A0ABT0SC53_9SPHN|nr:M20/M25/M40 family metallo-hydrolase [Sphingomonas brevis]MCL6741928.1 M20/M25/M40 family metallo-hydrolase [Sphingomonas brevis]